MKKRLWLALFIIFLPSLYALSYPQPVGSVNDFANILNNEAQLNQLIQEIQHNTTAEIAIVTVPSLEGVDIESYTIGLAEQWKVGKTDVDNGLIILIAPTEREYRIEVGYGLEGLLPDGYVGQLGRDILVPAFKSGNYGQGVYDLLLQVQQRLGGQEEVVSQKTSFQVGGMSPFTILLFPGVFLFFFILIFFSIILLFIKVLMRGKKGKHAFFHTSFTRGTGGFGTSGFGGFRGGFGGGFGGFGGGGFGGGGAGGRF